MQKSEYQNISKLENKHFWYRANREFSLALIDCFLPAKKPLSVLDIGCGPAGTTASLKKYGPVTAVDVSPIALKLARRHSLHRLILADVNKLPFKNKSFDLITSFDVLYHRGVEMPTALSEIHRVLRHKGIFLLRVPAFSWLEGSHDKIVHTARRFTADDLRKILDRSGFSILRLTYFNLSLLPAVFLARRLKPNSKSDIFPTKEPLNGLLYLLLSLESKIAQHINLPWGTSVYCLCTKP